MRKYFYELMTDARHGYVDRCVKACLWGFSKIYGFISTFTRALYQDHVLPVYRSPRPVVSVGNITTGGVGKTPLVIWLVSALTKQGRQVAVLSRGYKGDKHAVNDETRMFKEILPDVRIATGRDRKQSIQRVLAAQKVDVFIADDAFSHWPLHRDLDIVAIDASNPFGNGNLIPRGILREKVENLVRADVLVLTKTDKAKSTRWLCAELRSINSRALIIESRHVPSRLSNIVTGQISKLSDLNRQRVVALSAIGDPSSFEFTLGELGSEVARHFIFADHHTYSEEEIRQVLAWAVKENINILVTTHKDAVKIAAFKSLFQPFKVLSVEIELEITQGQDEIIKRIISLRRD